MQWSVLELEDLKAAETLDSKVKSSNPEYLKRLKQYGNLIVLK